MNIILYKNIKYINVYYRYVAIYSTELIKQQRSSTALELFIKYGAPAKPQNLNIYRHLATEILMEEKSDMKSWIGLRDIFYQLVSFLADYLYFKKMNEILYFR